MLACDVLEVGRGGGGREKREMKQKKRDWEYAKNAKNCNEKGKMREDEKSVR